MAGWGWATAERAEEEAERAEEEGREAAAAVMVVKGWVLAGVVMAEEQKEKAAPVEGAMRAEAPSELGRWEGWGSAGLAAKVGRAPAGAGWAAVGWGSAVPGSAMQGSEAAEMAGAG